MGCLGLLRDDRQDARRCPPISEPLQPVTIRNHVLKLAERLEDELGEEHASFIEGCPRDWGELSIPDGPLTVGIDGGYVKAQGMEQGVFEVIAGKSILAFRRDEETPEPSSQASPSSRRMTTSLGGVSLSTYKRMGCKPISTSNFSPMGAITSAIELLSEPGSRTFT